MSMDQLELLALAAAAKKRKAAPQSLDQRIAGGLKGITDVTGGVSGKAMESGTLGVIGDEFRAAIASIGPKTYDEALAEERAKERAFAAEHPVANASATVLGAAVPIGGAVSLPSRAMGLGGKIARSTGIGAVLGGINGFMEGEGGFRNRLESAMVGAGVGGGVGAVVPPAVAVTGKALGAVKEPILSALGIGNNRRVERGIADALRRSGQTQPQVDAALAQAAAEGQPEYMLADALGHAGQRKLSGIARRPGDVRMEIVDALENRQAGQGRRMGAEVAEQLAPGGGALPVTVPAGNAPRDVLGRTGPDVTGQGLEDALRRARGEAADAAYGAARTGAAPVDVRGAVGVIDQRIGPMQGSGVKDDAIGSKLTAFRNRLTAARPPAGTTAVDLSDFDRVLGVKQDVQDAVGEAVRAGRNNEARLLGGLQRELDAALEAASPGYRAANDEFAAASRVVDAVGKGREATGPRIRTADTAAQIGALTPDQKGAYGVGYGDRILGNVENAAPGVDKSRILTDDKVKADLGLLARDPDRLGRVVGREKTMFETRRQAIGGSQTADNLADSGDSSLLDASAIGNFLSGNFGTAARQTVSAVGHMLRGENEETRTMIARALLSNNPTQILQQAARRGQIDQTKVALIEALLNSAGSKAVYGMVQAP